MDVESLYRDYGKVLFGYIVAQAGDYNAAEDIFQETFLRIQRYGGSFSGAGSEKNYLFRTARNVFRDWLKRRRAEGQEMLEGIAAGGDPAVAAEHENLRAAIAACVRRLPGEEREVVLLREYEGMKITQIAMQLGIPEGTVKTRLRRGLQTLRSLLRSAGVLERL